MPVITLNGRSYPVNKETVLLDSLLEKRVRVPYSCRSGLCHACMLKADSGVPPVSSQKNLPREKIRKGYFLACQCLPEEDMQLSLPARNIIPAVIVGKEILSPTVVSLSVSPRFPLSCFPGQYLTLWASDHLARPCYLVPAEVPDNKITFHIERRINGAFSSWAHDCTSIGQKISISDLNGENICDSLPIPRLFIAQGSCLAPVLAACRHLFALKKEGISSDSPLTLSIQASHPGEIYCLDELQSMAKKSRYFKVAAFTGVGNQSELSDYLASLKGEHQFAVSGDRGFIRRIAASVNANNDLSAAPMIELPYSVD